MNSVTSQTISSNTLFHFTSKLEYLLGIIEKGFLPRYSLEDLSYFGIGVAADGTRWETGVPMVCFCDIPLSMIRDHLSVYNGYGIGLSKDWGRLNGIAPVLYCEENSQTTKAITDIKHFDFASLLKEELSNNELLAFSKTTAYIRRLPFFVKKYQGEFFHLGMKYPNKRFYDEREWRFIPNLEGLLEVPESISKESIAFQFELEDFRRLNNLKANNPYSELMSNLQDISPSVENVQKVYEGYRNQCQDDLYAHINKLESENKESNKSKIEELKLSFLPNQIRYIILDNEEEIEETIAFLEYKFKKSAPLATLQTLYTRILTKDQITQDF